MLSISEFLFKKKKISLHGDNVFFSLMAILLCYDPWHESIQSKSGGRCVGARKQPWFGKSHFLPTEAEVWLRSWFWVWGASPDPHWVPGPDACSVLWAPSYAGNTATSRTSMYTSAFLPAHKHMHDANNGKTKTKTQNTHTKGREGEEKTHFHMLSI